jgi:dTDP-4-amino-4,6-dideoxygalactose transaminase
LTVKISRYNYSAQFGETVGLLMQDLRKMLLDGNYILTEEVRRFEDAFAQFLGAKYARGVNSGTDALIIALLSLRVGFGDEVITQANGFHATAAAILLASAKPVLVDAHEGTFLVDEAQVSAAINSHTRALIPVHLYGKPTPMTGLLNIASKNSLLVVEDAAQAHGARVEGRAVGTFGAVGCFSFHPSKNLAAAGDGGALVTNDRELAGRIGLYRALGQRLQNDHVVVGLNSKLDAIQARILFHKLPFLEQWNEQRRKIAGWYRERLAGLPITVQETTPGETHACHLFPIRTSQRDGLLTHLHQRGVDAVVRYPTPIHLQPAFSSCGWKRGQFPVAERLAKELMCLPIRPDLPLSQVDYVTDCIRSFYGN